MKQRQEVFSVKLRRSIIAAECAGRSFAVACGQLLGGSSDGDCTVILQSYSTANVQIESVLTTTPITVQPGVVRLDLGGHISFGLRNCKLVHVHVRFQPETYDISGANRVDEGTETKTFYITSDADITVHVSNIGNCMYKYGIFYTNATFDSGTRGRCYLLHVRGP